METKIAVIQWELEGHVLDFLSPVYSVGTRWFVKGFASLSCHTRQLFKLLLFGTLCSNLWLNEHLETSTVCGCIPH